MILQFLSSLSWLKIIKHSETAIKTVDGLSDYTKTLKTGAQVFNIIGEGEEKKAPRRTVITNDEEKKNTPTDAFGVAKKKGSWRHFWDGINILQSRVFRRILKISISIINIAAFMALSVSLWPALAILGLEITIAFLSFAAEAFDMSRNFERIRRKSLTSKFDRYQGEIKKIKDAFQEEYGYTAARPLLTQEFNPFFQHHKKISAFKEVKREAAPAHDTAISSKSLWQKLAEFPTHIKVFFSYLFAHGILKTWQDYTTPLARALVNALGSVLTIYTIDKGIGFVTSVYRHGIAKALPTMAKSGYIAVGTVTGLFLQSWWLALPNYLFSTLRTILIVLAFRGAEYYKMEMNEQALQNIRASNIRHPLNVQEAEVDDALTKATRESKITMKVIKEFKKQCEALKKMYGSKQNYQDLSEAQREIVYANIIKVVLAGITLKPEELSNLGEALLVIPADQRDAGIERIKSGITLRFRDQYGGPALTSAERQQVQWPKNYQPTPCHSREPEGALGFFKAAVYKSFGSRPKVNYYTPAERGMAR